MILIPRHTLAICLRLLLASVALVPAACKSSGSSDGTGGAAGGEGGATGSGGASATGGATGTGGSNATGGGAGTGGTTTGSGGAPPRTRGAAATGPLPIHITPSTGGGPPGNPGPCVNRA